MIRALLTAATAHVQPRVIYDRDGLQPYLSRYYLMGKPSMPDGSPVFDVWGNPRPGAAWPKGGAGIYLHRFHRGDSDPELHNHPWRWAVSLILAGGYREYLRTRGDDVASRDVKPGRVNAITADTFHRVELLDGECWSLFVAGPKVSGWGFWCSVTKRFTEWREFVAKRQGGVKS
jgi:hypothetical protein